MSIDKAWVRKLAAIAVQAPSADNCQPWSLRWDGRDLAIDFAQRAEGNLFGATGHATLVSVGAVAENIEAGLTTNRLPFSCHLSSNPSVGSPYATFRLESVPPDFDFVAPVGPASRHTNRLPYRKAALPANTFRELSQHEQHAVRVVALSDSERRARLTRIVRLCSEARFCDQQLHEWLIKSLRFTSEEVSRGDGLDVSTLGLPPGGQLLLRFISDWRRTAMLNRFGAYKLFARLEVVALRAAPVLVCIIGPRDLYSVIDAGRLMTRLWTELNLKGIAVQPYYVATDQFNRFEKHEASGEFHNQIAAAEQEMRAVLELGSHEILHMILRIGYPTREPVRSKRLPLNVVFHDDSGTRTQTTRN